MGNFPKLESMLKAALERAAMDGGMLLGHELELKEAAGDATAKQAYVAQIDYASFFLPVKSQEEYEGTFYLVFTLRDAIVLGSLLLGVPLARVSEKKKLAILESDDVDAFSEFANQVIGSFNSVFKPTLPKKAHLKLLEPRKFIPREVEVTPEGPIPDGDYYIMRAQLGMAEQDLDQLDILIPASLASFYDLQGSAPAETPCVEAPESDSEEAPPETVPAAAEEPTVLILEENSADLRFFQEAFASTAVKTMTAAPDADLGDILPAAPVSAVLLGAEDADEREFSICIKIKTISTNCPVPVIICAREWTRSGVLKALKYGAADIIMKPCSPDELKERVMKVLHAA